MRARQLEDARRVVEQLGARVRCRRARPRFGVGEADHVGRRTWTSRVDDASSGTRGLACGRVRRNRQRTQRRAPVSAISSPKSRPASTPMKSGGAMPSGRRALQEAGLRPAAGPPSSTVEEVGWAPRGFDAVHHGGAAYYIRGGDRRRAAFLNPRARVRRSAARSVGLAVGERRCRLAVNAAPAGLQTCVAGRGARRSRPQVDGSGGTQPPVDDGAPSAGGDVPIAAPPLRAGAPSATAGVDSPRRTAAFEACRLPCDSVDPLAEPYFDGSPSSAGADCANSTRSACREREKTIATTAARDDAASSTRERARARIRRALFRKPRRDPEGPLKAFADSDPAKRRLAAVAEAAVAAPPRRTPASGRRTRGSEVASKT